MQMSVTYHHSSALATQYHLPSSYSQTLTHPNAERSFPIDLLQSHHLKNELNHECPV